MSQGEWLNESQFQADLILDQSKLILSPTEHSRFEAFAEFLAGINYRKLVFNLLWYYTGSNVLYVGDDTGYQGKPDFTV